MVRHYIGSDSTDKAECLHRRGWSLIVEAGFNAKHLRRLLSVLEQES